MRILETVWVMAVAAACLGQTAAPTGDAAAGGTSTGARKAKPAGDDLRKEWVDPETGHRIWRLSTEMGSKSLYFHYNAFSPGNTKVVFNSPSGIMVAELDTKKASLLVPRPGRGEEPAATGPTVGPSNRLPPFGAMETSRVGNDVFYIQNGAVLAADLTTKKTREIVKLPVRNGRPLPVTCVNADATLFAGTIRDIEDPSGATPKPPALELKPQMERMFPGKKPEDLTPEQRSAAQKEDRLSRQLLNPAPMAIFTLNAKTGEMRIVHYAWAWLNHLQWSPSDPKMLMFCHEGTWHEVDRVWTVNAGDVGGGAGEKPVAKLMHKRTMDMEIAGHEWWAPDGKSVWFDLQTPRSVQFWIAGVDLATGQETKYHLEREWWGIHFGVSPDMKMYCSDGGDPGQVAYEKDGQWLNLLRVQPDGTLTREKLVDMRKHNYVTVASGGINGVEPNAVFSPDGKLIIFTGNFDGGQQVYAVEVEKGGAK
jgi:oligogalacturonide lyase